jgi:hypothetical protein
MPDTINQAEERQLHEAVKRAVDLVDDGMSPDDAIEKVAREEKFGPGRIRLVAHAYNTGRQTSQWRDGGNILDKLAHFDLADPEKVIHSIYNGPTAKEKAARDRVDEEYRLPPSWVSRPTREKAARAPLPVTVTPPEPYQKDPVEALHRAYGQVQRAKQASEEAGRQASAAEDRVRRHVAELVTYFKQARDARLPFEHVEVAARTYLGQASVPLMDVVYKQARLREKRASAQAPLLTNAINIRTEPFTIIRDCVKAAEDCNRLRLAARGSHEKVASVKEEVFRPFSKAGASKPPAQPSSAPTPGVGSRRAAAVFGVEKSSHWGSEVAAIAAGDVIGTGVHKKLEQGDAQVGNEVNQEVADLDDNPEVESIKKQVQLANLISGGPPLKEAALDAALGQMLTKGVGSFPKSKDDLVTDAWTDLEDPHHQNELRKIRTHAMLHGMLTDPEDPISGHDPDKVLRAYNEISQMSPRLADHPAALRPLLRRRLEAHPEPFEAKEQTEIEKGLAAAKMPTPHTTTLLEAPANILG